MNKTGEINYFRSTGDALVFALFVNFVVLFCMETAWKDKSMRVSNSSILEAYLGDDYKSLEDWSTFASSEVKMLLDQKAAEELLPFSPPKEESNGLKSTSFVSDSSYFPKKRTTLRQPTQRKRRQYRGKPEFLVDSGFVKGNFYGVVGSLNIQKTYSNRRKWDRNGALVEEVLQTLPGAAIHSFWITEKGIKIPAVVRAATAASRDFNATVRKNKDPGLIQWVKANEYKFSLFPVLNDGTPKVADYHMDSVYEVDSKGWIEAIIPVGRLHIKKLEVDITVNSPFRIYQFSIPSELKVTDLGGNTYRIHGSFLKLSGGQDDIKIAWKYPHNKLFRPCTNPDSKLSEERKISTVFNIGQLLSPIRNGSPDSGIVQYGNTLTIASLSGLPSKRGNHSLSLVFPGTNVAGKLGKLTLFNETKRKSMVIDILTKEVYKLPALPVKLEERIVAGMTVEKLSSELAMSNFSVNDGLVFTLPEGSNEERAETIAELSINNNMASPLAALYAKPDLVKADTIADISRDEIRTLKIEKRPKPASPSPSGNQSGYVETVNLSAPSPNRNSGGWLGFSFVPNFQSSRRISYERGCFANQKTIAGALEMFSLDYNVDWSAMFSKKQALLAAEKRLKVARSKKILPPFQPGPEYAFIADHSIKVSCLHKIPVSKIELPERMHYDRRNVEGTPLNIRIVNCDDKVVYSLENSPFNPLVNGGYLQSKPICSSRGAKNYLIAGERVFCPIHGPVMRSDNWREHRATMEISSVVTGLAIFLVTLPLCLIFLRNYLSKGFSGILLIGFAVGFFINTPVITMILITIVEVIRAILNEEVSKSTILSVIVVFLLVMVGSRLIFNLIPEIATSVSLVAAEVFLIVKLFREWRR